MAELKYTVIKSEEQYDKYCNLLEDLVFGEVADEMQDEIELLTLLIEDWDEKHKLGPEVDPVELVNVFMNDHGLNQTELGKIAGYGKSYISEILNYKKRMPKKMIRNVAGHFKIRQEALNKPYRLEGERVDGNEKEGSTLSSIFDIKSSTTFSRS